MYITRLEKCTSEILEFFMVQNAVYIISKFTCFAIETVKNNGKNTVIYVSIL